jgi:hypothetical protein
MEKRGKYKASNLTPGAAALLAHVPVPDDIDGEEADAIVQVRSAFLFVNKASMMSGSIHMVGICGNDSFDLYVTGIFLSWKPALEPKEATRECLQLPFHAHITRRVIARIPVGMCSQCVSRICFMRSCA